VGAVDGGAGLWKVEGVDKDGGSPGDNAAVVERRACGAGGEDPTDRKPLLSVFMGPLEVGAIDAVVVMMSKFIGGPVGAEDRRKGAVGAAGDASTGEGPISSDIARHAMCKKPVSIKIPLFNP